MTDLLTRPSARRSVPVDRINRRGSLEPREPGRPRRSLVVALVLACLTLMTLDHVDDGAVVDPMRRLAGEVLGPAESGLSRAVGPVVAVPDRVRSNGDLAARVDELERENDQLRAELGRTDYDRNRLSEYDDLTATAETIGYALVPARVVAIGPTQSFSRTVTIDAGSRAGLAPDMTVVNGRGLVGRVLRVTSRTATVLLIGDRDSTIGVRAGRSMKVGFLHGRGEVGEQARLDLELVDPSHVLAVGESVVTWGSQDGAPYVAGVPVGQVEAVSSSPRESAFRAVIVPYVDFSALDLVGVVVASGTSSDRAVIEVDGSLR